MTSLTRYWLTFVDLEPGPSALRIGCGVSAYSKEDVMRLLQARVFKEKPLPSIGAIVEDIDVTQLDTRVVSNMGVVSERGIWFPLGYGEEL
jgi:hypothetical protein